MARKITDSKLQSRNARRSLLQNSADNPHPCFVKLQKGLHLGYRKGAKGGTWIARRHIDGMKYDFRPLGVADDHADADGRVVLSYDQAQDGARTWFDRSLGGVPNDKYTVADAAQDWLDKWDGSELSKKTSEANVKHHIVDRLGKIEVAELKRKDVEAWLHHVANKPPIRATTTFDSNDPNVKRMRRETANRVFRDLKALLNAAYKNQYVKDTAAWETVPEFKNVSVKKMDGVLTLDEAKRVLDACEPDFKNIVYAALVTGCRYGEICKMRTEHYKCDSKMITVLQAKTGKEKYIYLTDEEAAFFAQQTDGKKLDDVMFVRADGKQWDKSKQQPRIRAALKKAGITRHVRFHDLRHTFGSLLANRGVPMEIIQKQLGHSSMRVTEQFYVHLTPSYIAAGVRANKPSFDY